jgi:[ribosomal protein S18]-alanine N-acetyltransferase
VTVRIIAAGPTDIASILPVMEHAFDPQFGEAWTASQCLSMLSLPGTRFATCWTADKAVGFAIARTVFDETELLLIAVDPSFAGQGIGSQLLDHVVTESVDLGAKRLHVEVRSDNQAIEFYSARGFVKVGTRPNYYRRKDGGPTHAITMVNDINC